MKKHKVTIIEFDPTWMQRLNSEVYFETEEAAKTYVDNFNKVNSVTEAEGYLLANYFGIVDQTEKIQS
jgi:hypothetical protein